MSPETPFRISVPDNKIDLLKKKLDLVTFPDELEDAGHDYGVPLADLRRLVARWRDGYDWRKHEAALNDELPQFTRDIEVDRFGTLNIHYVHKKSEAASAIPLLFLHGWPGSFFEVRKILPLLVESSHDHPSFHVVALSLPGYGFSEAPSKKAFAITQYAEVGNKLMLALGYNEYVTQAGDWGAVISRRIAEIYGGKHNKAWHTNFPLVPQPSLWSKPFVVLSQALFGFSEADKDSLDRTKWYRTESMGYFHEQSMKPQTLGYGLTDSPVGLLAWIYEGLVNWTDEYPWEDDEVLTWISIYLFSRAGPAASLRIYYEFYHHEESYMAKDKPNTTPMGHSYFPKEIFRFPKSWLKASNLVFQADHAKGGHFAAYEKPQELVGDLRKMFGKDGPAFGVVPGKTGYDI